MSRPRSKKEHRRSDAGLPCRQRRSADRQVGGCPGSASAPGIRHSISLYTNLKRPSQSGVRGLTKAMKGSGEVTGVENVKVLLTN